MNNSLSQDLIESINQLTHAVKTQDNHVLADLDTYPVVTVLTEIRDELKQINTQLTGLRHELEEYNGGA
jgi:hypothetical protein